MANLIHIAEIAGLLFVAYAVGWIVGYLARRLSSPKAKPVEATVDRPAVPAAPPAEAPLVAAPEIVAVTAAKPFVASVTPAPPDASAALASLTEQKPFAPPLVTTPLTGATPAPVKIPEIFDTPLQTQPEAKPAAPEPEPVTEPEVFVPEPSTTTAPAPVAMPANLPGQAWAGEIRGRESPRYEPPAPKVMVEESATAELDVVPKAPPSAAGEPTAIPVAAEGAVDLTPVLETMPADLAAESAPPPAASPVVAPLVEAVRQAEAAVAEALAQTATVLDPAPVAPDVPQPSEAAAAPLAEPPARETIIEPEPLTEPPQAETAVEPAPVLSTIAAPTPPSPPPAARVEYDEDAAMRAIEGGWSRRASRALPDMPELSDVSAAVAAAQVAVEQVLVQSGVDPTVDGRTSGFGKPRALARPRDGEPDDLKSIQGVSPLDEATLNNLGIYHFDQVAGWDQKEVLWLENHAFARGRIGRENWQEQARARAGERSAVRAAR